MHPEKLSFCAPSPVVVVTLKATTFRNMYTLYESKNPHMSYDVMMMIRFVTQKRYVLVRYMMIRLVTYNIM
jgi:hypothetical protein